ncbi:Transcriptional adapter ada2 [Tulasnella sp. JGI-2019a]|nr:Transcriptional adapter ada2 [Tulasnella sp. JGI-2019a]
MTVTNRKPVPTPDTIQAVDLEPGLLVECDSCNANITHSVHIRCAAEECRITNIDLCPVCFCKGKEVGKHKATHPYRVIERHSYPIFTEDWGADEELLLIDGLLTSGMGSWADAAEHIGTRTREEVEAHYNEVYVNSEDWPMPNMNATFDFDIETFQAKKKRRIEDIQKTPVEVPAIPPKPLVSAPTNHEIAGFMPGRLEFETEVENEAEDTVKDLEFGLVMDYGGREQPEGDPPAAIVETNDSKDPEEAGGLRKTDPSGSKGLGGGESSREGDEDDKDNQDDDGPQGPPPLDTHNSVAFKLALLSMYNEKVNKRLETKAVVFDRGLLEFKKLQAIERKRTKEEKDFINKHKPFARLQTANDFETFIDGLLYEQQLRKRIQELQEFRRMGITTLAEAERYEKEKAARLSARGRDYRHSIEPEGDPNISRSGRRGGPLSLATASSLHLLSPQEQALCSQLRILPKPYLAIKEAIIREYAKKGGKLRKRDAKDMFKIETHKTARIWEFLEKSGVFKPYTLAAAAAAAAQAQAQAALASSSEIAGASVTASAPPSQVGTSVNGTTIVGTGTPTSLAASQSQDVIMSTPGPS